MIGFEVVRCRARGGESSSEAHGLAEAVCGHGVGGGEIFVQRLGVLHLEVGDSEGGEVLPQDVVEILGLFFRVARGVETAAVFGEVAEALLGDVPLSEPSDAVESWRCGGWC